MSDFSDALAVVVKLAIAVLSGVFVLALVRVVRGPTLPDRVVGLDLGSTAAVALLACYALLTDSPALLNVGVVVALVAFLSTIAFASYIQKGR